MEAVSSTGVPPERTAEATPNSEQLFSLLYEELHRLARSQLRKGAAVSLSATTLLHEAYLDMSRREPLVFPDRARFLAYAARAMRGLVIDYARSCHAQKRGGDFALIALDTEIAEGSEDALDAAHLTRIGDALGELARVDLALAELVDLRFFCGLALAEIAALRSVSERTVQRDWRKARLYLRRSLADELPG
jgi:RNA polymerase sigma factor (TIGR02999 family)